VKKRTERRKLNDELRREYDLSKLKGVRGKHATRYHVESVLPETFAQDCLGLRLSSSLSKRTQ
jgi:hypothetical protein